MWLLQVTDPPGLSLYISTPSLALTLMHLQVTPLVALVHTLSLGLN